MSHQTGAKLRLIFAMTAFGTLGLFIRVIPLPSSMIALVRGAVGSGFLLLVCALRRTMPDKAAIRRNLKFLLPCGIAMGFNWILLFEAYRYTTVAVATLCYYLSPVIILLLSPLLLKEKLTGLKAGCIAAALVGMFLVSGVVQGGVGSTGFTGILLGLGAAVLYAFIVLLSKQLTDIRAFDTTIMELSISAVVMLVYNFITVDFTVLLACPPVGLVSLAVVAIFHTGVCYALYFGALPLLSAQTAALFSYIDPVVAILLSALFLHEPMDGLSIIGAVLILGSTLFGELVEGRKKKSF